MIKLKDLSRYYAIQNLPFSQRGYIAPTVFAVKNTVLPRMNFYDTKQKAINQYYYLKNATGSPQTPFGNIPLKKDGTNQTIGINVDLYADVEGKWTVIPYGFYKYNLSEPYVFSFYTTAGVGPYWAIYSPPLMGTAATVVNGYSPEKILALDEFQREVQLLKIRYNALISFAKILSERQLSPKEQQIFNSTMLTITTMQGQIAQIQGIEIIYSPTGKIGFVWLLIAVIAILTVGTAWTITTIQNQREKTKRINDSFQLTQWVANKKVEIAQDAMLTQSEKDSIYRTLDQAAGIATTVAENSSEHTSIFTDITSLAKWALFGFVVIEGVKYLKTQKA